MSLYLYDSAPRGEQYLLSNKVRLPHLSPATPAYGANGDDPVVFNHSVLNGNHFAGRDMTQVGYDTYALMRPPLYGWTGSLPDPAKPPLHIATPNIGGGRVIARAQ